MSGRSHKRDLRAELEGDMGTDPVIWEPEPGDILVGTFIRYERGEWNHNDTSIALIEDETGRYIFVWLASAVLNNEFQKLSPRRGDRVAIKCFGPIEGVSYRGYRLIVDKPGDGFPF